MLLRLSHGGILPHSTNGVFNLDISNDLSTQCLDLFQELALWLNAFSECCLEIWLGRGGIGAIWE